MLADAVRSLILHRSWIVKLSRCESSSKWFSNSCVSYNTWASLAKKHYTSLKLFKTIQVFKTVNLEYSFDPPNSQGSTRLEARLVTIKSLWTHIKQNTFLNRVKVRLPSNRAMLFSQTVAAGPPQAAVNIITHRIAQGEDTWSLVFVWLPIP